MAEDPLIRNLRQRLERWELKHLREHARQMSDTIDELRQQLDDARSAERDAEAIADYWRKQVEELRAELAADLAVGMEQDGTMHLVSTEEVA